MRGGVKRLLEEHAAGPPPGDSNSQQFHPASEIDLLRQRQDFWWISSEVKVACREIIVARERQSDVAESGDLMNTLLMRLCKLQGWRSYRGIRAVSKNNHSVLRAKEWWQESHALQNITIPVIHRLPEEQLQKKQRRQSPPHQLIHYHLSQVVVEHATQISKRLKQLDSTAAELSLKGDDTSPTDAACLQEISKCSKQTRLAFLEMCRKDAHNVPFSAFEHITGMQTAVTSQNLRHLSLIDLGGVSYRQLPLSNATLCALIRRHAEGRSHGYETQYDFIQEAKRRLREYANCSDDVYASLRFLGLALIKEMEDVNTKTSLWIDTFIELMDANKLGSCWQGWHPNRLAAAATYLHLFVAKPQETMSRRHARIRAKAIYMPACDIHSLQALASHSLPLHVCESGAASPRVEDGAASPRAEDGSNDALAPRVAVVQTLEASQQAIASPPVVCELCHKGFIGRDALAAHCNQAHGNWAEYRKRLFFMAWQAGLRPLLPWVKRSMLHSHAFFSRYSVPCCLNDWSRRVSAAQPRRQQACAICAIRDWLERRVEMYLFTAADGTTTKTNVFYGSNAFGGVHIDEEDEANSPKQRLLTKRGKLCAGPAEKVDKILSVYNYIKDWPKIPAEELHASSIEHPEHRHMRWLLHTRRIPKTEACVEDGMGRTLPRCAGSGIQDQTVWACWDCAASLCRDDPIMPDLALANWMWLGRMYPGYKNISLAMRMLLGRGRPVMRKLYLGRGPRDEVHQGLQGNTLIVAQPSARFTEVVPNVHHCCSSLVLLFCKSVDDVRNAHALVVQREQYKECMQRRIHVCSTFADVVLSDNAMTRTFLPTMFHKLLSILQLQCLRWPQ